MTIEPDLIALELGCGTAPARQELTEDTPYPCVRG